MWLTLKVLLKAFFLQAYWNFHVLETFKLKLSPSLDKSLDLKSLELGFLLIVNCGTANNVCVHHLFLKGGIFLLWSITVCHSSHVFQKLHKIWLPEKIFNWNNMIGGVQCRWYRGNLKFYHFRNNKCFFSTYWSIYSGNIPANNATVTISDCVNLLYLKCRNRGQRNYIIAAWEKELSFAGLIKLIMLNSWKEREMKQN